MKTCRNCAEYWWCKETWSKYYADDIEINCKAWKSNHKWRNKNDIR